VVPPPEAGQHEDLWEAVPPARSRAVRRGAVFAVAGLILLTGLTVAGITTAGWLDATSAEPGTAGQVGRAGPSSEASPTESVAVPGVAGSDPAAVAEAFLEAWEAGDYEGMQALATDEDDNLAGAYRGMAERLGVTAVDAVPGEFDRAAGRLPFEVTLTLDGLGEVSWRTAVPVRSAGRFWQVRWTADTVYPGLVAGQRLDLVEVPARRELVDVSGRPLRDDPDLAANLVGRVDESGFGGSGLQRALDADLTGSPATAVAVVNATTGEVVSVVREWPGPGSEPLATTLDLRVQGAAREALAGVAGRSALVAVDVPTGGVLAVANSPVEGLPVALAGAYPPGSTFKIVTATAALRSGLTASSTVDCPATTTAGGRPWTNIEAVTPGPMTLSRALAVSCNTAFVDLATGPAAPAMTDAAATFGFDGSSPLPVRSYSGVAPPAEGAEAAAGAIGQGQVLASPLHMATVAAAVASGTWHRPHLVACPGCESRPVPEAPALQGMLREAVTDGTATALAGVPGGAVAAKTGTAEAAGGSHAWTVGYQGDVAFAVLVENGGSGSQVAAPIAAEFLTALAAG
jgi:hypothetical protein